MSKNRASFNALAEKLGIGKSSGPIPLKTATDRPGKIPETGKRNKFGAVRCEADGFKFDSLKERKVYFDFKYKKAAGLIQGFVMKTRYEFVHDGIKIGHYTSDFDVTELDGSVVVYDVKGGKATKTEAYLLRKAAMRAFYKIEVKEI